jgi:hypothetical protein
VRGWRDDARIDAMLKRLGDRPIVLHPSADASRFQLDTHEQTVLEAAREFELPLDSLIDADLAEPPLVRARARSSTRWRSRGTSISDRRKRGRLASPVASVTRDRALPRSSPRVRSPAQIRRWPTRRSR